MNKTMNTVSQTFNWSRFVATLRKELVENRRAILFSIIGIYALEHGLNSFGITGIRFEIPVCSVPVCLLCIKWP